MKTHRSLWVLILFSLIAGSVGASVPARAASFPVIRTTNSGTAAAVPGPVTFLTIPYPASVLRGDLILSLLGADNGFALVVYEGPWVVIEGGPFIGVGPGAPTSLYAAYTIYDGLQTEYQINVTASSTWRYINYDYSVGTHSGVAYSTNSVTGPGIPSAPDAPPLLPPPGAADYDWVAFASWDSAAAVVGCPPNYLDVVEVSGASPGLGACDRQLTAATDDPAPFVMSANPPNWAAGTVAVRGLAPPPKGNAAPSSVSGEMFYSVIAGILLLLGLLFALYFRSTYALFSLGLLWLFYALLTYILWLNFWVSLGFVGVAALVLYASAKPRRRR